jgi:transposase
MKTLHLTCPNYDKVDGTTGVSSEGARRATGEETPVGHRLSSTAAPPDPEVPEVKPRRRFTAAYKLRILKQADQLTQPGQIGALLRKEGLYSSNLVCWRKQRDQGVLNGLTPAKRGRKPKAQNPLDKRITELERENRQLQNKLRQARIIIEAQKKISEILGIEQNLENIDDNK